MYKVFDSGFQFYRMQLVPILEPIDQVLFDQCKLRIPGAVGL